MEDSLIKMLTGLNYPIQYCMLRCIPRHFPTIAGATLALLLFTGCSSDIEEARAFVNSTEKKGAALLIEMAEICGKGYLVGHTSTEALKTAEGWRLQSRFYVRDDAKVRSIVEATQKTRWHIADFMECMFIASDNEKVTFIEAKVTFSPMDDIFNPLLLGQYSLDRTKLDELENWQEKPSFLDRHRVSQFIEARMTTDLEDWSEMQLE